MVSAVKLNSDVHVTLSKQVKAYRSQAGLTQQMLADKCGIYRTYLSRIESGSANPSIGVLVGLASTLNVEVYKLFVE